MTDTYQVVAECAYVTVDAVTGRATQLLLKGALVPGDAPELERLVRDKYVAKVGGDETGGVDAAGVPAAAYNSDVPASLTSTPAKSTEQQTAEAAAAKADAELADRRAAAQAKLPEGGAMPDGRAGKDVWVEYLVAKGSRYEDVAAADRDELMKLAKQQES